MDIIAFALAVAIVIIAVHFSRFLFGRHDGRHRTRGVLEAPPANATSKALETYERLAREKLEVIKTALAMGYSDQEIAALDARLEKLIGKDKLDSLLAGGGAQVMADADLLDTALDREVERLQKMRQT